MLRFSLKKNQMKSSACVFITSVFTFLAANTRAVAQSHISFPSFTKLCLAKYDGIFSKEAANYDSELGKARFQMAGHTRGSGMFPGPVIPGLFYLPKDLASSFFHLTKGALKHARVGLTSSLNKAAAENYSLLKSAESASKWIVLEASRLGGHDQAGWLQVTEALEERLQALGENRASYVDEAIGYADVCGSEFWANSVFYELSPTEKYQRCLTSTFYSMYRSPAYAALSAQLRETDASLTDEQIASRFWQGVTGNDLFCTVENPNVMHLQSADDTLQKLAKALEPVPAAGQ